MSLWWRALWVGLVLLTAAAAPPTPTAAQVSTPGIVFTADGAPGAATIFLQATDTTDLNSPFVLEVRADEVSDLYGIAFDLDFPADLLRWEENGTAAGDLLSDSGDVESRVLADRASRDGRGHLIVGATRLGAVSGAEGSGLLLSLEFENRGKRGAGDFVITMNSAFDSTGAVLDSVRWVSGSIESDR